MSDLGAEKTYEFVSDGIRKRVTVPASWRCTYGQVVPGQRSGGGYALRFYETTSKDSTRAIFTEVTEFRDTSIAVMVMAYRMFGAPDDEWFIPTGSSYWEKQHEGQYEVGWIDQEKLKDPPLDEDPDSSPFKDGGTLIPKALLPTLEKYAAAKYRRP